MFQQCHCLSLPSLKDFPFIWGKATSFITSKAEGSKAGTGHKGYYRCRKIIATNLGKRRLTRHRSALPANPTSSRPRSWSLGNATFVVAERSGWRRVLGASKPRPSAKRAHRNRKRACLEALRFATAKLTQRGTGYPSWGHSNKLRISRGSTELTPLQTTRKENNWKTEEALAQVAVSLETERIEGSNPWCLWWWWWWWWWWWRRFLYNLDYMATTSDCLMWLVTPVSTAESPQTQKTNTKINT